MSDSFEELTRDIDRQIQRAQTAKALEFKYELANNVYPMIKMILASVGERFDTVEEVVSEIADGGGEAFIPPEVLELVAALMQLSTTIADRFEAAVGDKITPDEKTATTMLREVVAKLDGLLNEYAEGEDDEDEDDEDEEK